MVLPGLFRFLAIKEYQRYRKAGMNLNHKIIDAFVDGKVIEKAARALDLGRNRQLVLDSEDEISVLMDFALYEIRQDGKNLVERYQEEKGGSNAIERELLAAMVKATAGLFRVESVLPQRYCLILQDLTEEGRSITLTDINFSQTVQKGLIIFSRPVEVAKFTMTSGIAFVFPQTMEQELVKQRKLKWQGRNSAERYAYFFKMSKRKGLSTIYV